MKTVRFASMSALFLLGLAAPGWGGAPVMAQAASGIYDFTLGDKALKHVEFDCQALSGGGASGRLFLSDQATVVYQDVDGDGSPQEKYAGFNMTVALDDMSVVKNQAVMSGVVRDSSIQFLVGLRVLFTVEDNGTDPRQPDRLTWGAYKRIDRNWIPSDAEWKEDPGVGLRWWATDAERRDDVGYQMPRPDTTGTIPAFSLSAYDFVVMDSGSGDIVVRP